MQAHRTVSSLCFLAATILAGVGARSSGQEIQPAPPEMLRDALRAFPNGIPPDGRIEAIEKMRRMEAVDGGLGSGGASNLANAPAKWVAIGPSAVTGGQTLVSKCHVEVSGRATAIAVNPKNPNDVWLGTAQGGVWHSTNGGKNWKPTSDDQASLAVGSITLDACDASGCGTVYVGTGENSLRRDTYYGAGLLVGTIASPGQLPSWQLRGSSLFRLASIVDVVLDPKTSGATKRIYVALSSGVTASASESTITAPPPPQGYGIYKSEDQGKTWTKLDIPVIAGATGSRPTDLEMDPFDSNVLFAGFYGQGIFKGTRNPVTGGVSWCALNPGFGASGCPADQGLPDPTTCSFDFVEIAIDRKSSSPATLYAIFGMCFDPIVGDCNSPLYRSVDGGTSWEVRTFFLPDGYSRYTHTLTIHPTDPDIIVYGGVGLHISSDGGQTFGEIGSCSLHPDHHAVVFPDPSKPERMYVANDGGFYFAPQEGDTIPSFEGVGWQSGNGDLQITSFQSITASPLTTVVIGGTQDNGTNLYAGSNVWKHVDGGDAASTVISLDDPSIYYDIYLWHPFTFPSMGPRRSPKGGACCAWPFIKTGLDLNDAGAFYAPLVQSYVAFKAPDLSGYPDYHPLYFGTNRVYWTVGPPGPWPNLVLGDQWEPISCAMGGSTEFFPDIQTTNVITAIAPSPNDPARLYVGYYDGQVFVRKSLCRDPECINRLCWAPASGSGAQAIPRATVTRIAVDPIQPDVAYLTLSGFQLPGCAHVYKTANAGATWTRASGPAPCDPTSTTSLPDVPANTIHIFPGDPSVLLVGTDIGIFRSKDKGATWAPYMGSGSFRLPNVPVYEIAIDETHGRIIAGTHGRGAFMVLEKPDINVWELTCPLPCPGIIYSFLDDPVQPTQDITIDLVRFDGQVIASGNRDAQGNRIEVGQGGIVETVSPSGDRHPGFWASFNGVGVGGADVAGDGTAASPIAQIAVTVAGQRTVRQLEAPSAVMDPPSATLGLPSLDSNGPTGGPIEGGGAGLPGAGKVVTIRPMLVEAGGSMRKLCEVTVPLRSSDSAESALARMMDAVSTSGECVRAGVKATLAGVPIAGEVAVGEDLPPPSPRLALSAPGLSGIELLPAVQTGPGQAAGLSLQIDDIGVSARRQIVPMSVAFGTLAVGAMGGKISVFERTPLGVCSIVLTTRRGEPATEIAAAIGALLRGETAPGGKADCPSEQNPRDAIVEGATVHALFATSLVVLVEDMGVGLSFEPGLPPAPTPPSPNGQVPGDCNQDGLLDISDAVCVFGNLFLGNPRSLPCGSGLPGDLGNVALLDWQPDGRVDISDGIGLLQYLFGGGPPHPKSQPGAAGRSCVPLSGCPTGSACR